MDRSMDQLAGRLLIQCRTDAAGSVRGIAETFDGGLVLTGRSPEPVVKHLRDNGFTAPILCDADRYSGRGRTHAAAGTNPGWCRRQRAMGLVPLTDSGYLAANDLPGLRTILREAAVEPSPTVAVLPLEWRWFGNTEALAAAIAELNRFGVPVALVLEHSGDPFSVEYVVRGVLELLDTAAVPVMLLRSDCSAIGALCHGAHTAATGTTSALRHLYPYSGGGGARRPAISVFVKALLGYHRWETVEEFVAETPDLEQLWSCECPICAGATADRIGGGDGSGFAATRHSLYSQLGLHEEIFRRPRSRSQLASSWHEACSHAGFVHAQLSEVIRGWTQPASLRHWCAVTDDPLPRNILPVQAVARDATFPHDVLRPLPDRTWSPTPFDD